MSNIKLKRAYEPAANNDGYRILVDRLWPRGVTKDKLKVDFWAKDIAPSTELRKWFGHDPQKWQEFSSAYLFELEKNPAVGRLFTEIKKHKTVTLIYAAKDTKHTHALILQQFLDEKPK